MELQDFIKKFAEQFDDTEVANFKENTKFKELDEWSSLMALNIVAMVDEEYGISLRGDDIRNSDTVNDLFEKIKSKI